MPDRIVGTIPPIGATSEQSDPFLHVKWFTPDAGWTWFVAYAACGISDEPCESAVRREPFNVQRRIWVFGCRTEFRNFRRNFVGKKIVSR